MAQIVVPDKAANDLIPRLVRQIALMEARNFELQEALYYHRTTLCQREKQWRRVRERGDTHANAS